MLIYLVLVLQFLDVTRIGLSLTTQTKMLNDIEAFLHFSTVLVCLRRGEASASKK